MEENIQISEMIQSVASHQPPSRFRNEGDHSIDPAESQNARLQGLLSEWRFLYWLAHPHGQIPL
jgi:hypothetical protein